MDKSNVTYKKDMRAALYLRVSTDEQAKEGTSLETQEERCREFCRSQGYTIADEHVYRDDISGALPPEKRPELSRLYEAVESGEFDIVIVFKIDRLARANRVLLNILHDLGGKNIAFRSVSENFDTATPYGESVLQMYGMFAQLERGMIKERTTGGRIKSAQAGNWVSGIPPYGYTKNKKTKKLEIEPRESRVVKKMYRWLVNEKLSLSEIERRMNKLKVPAPWANKITARKTHNYWHKRTIGRILTNEVYIGNGYYGKYKQPYNNLTSVTDSQLLRPKEDWVLIPTPVIISKEMYEDAKKQLLENREHAKRNKKREYLYSKLIYCNVCGFKMFGGYQPPRKRWQYEGGRYYHGTYRKKDAVGKSERCKWCPQYSEARLEPIWNCLKEILKNPKNMNAPLKEYLIKEEDPKVVQEQLGEIADRLDEVRNKRERITELLISGRIEESKFEQHDKECGREEQKLTDEATRLRQSLITNKERKERQALVEKSYTHIKEKLDDLTYEQKAEIIRFFIERITLHASDNYAKVVFRFNKDVELPANHKKDTETDSFLLVLNIRTISEAERRAFILRMNPGMYIPKALV